MGGRGTVFFLRYLLQTRERCFARDDPDSVERRFLRKEVLGDCRSQTLWRWWRVVMVEMYADKHR